MTCNHPQCCICLKRECQQLVYEPRFKSYGELYVCGASCLGTAVHVAYEAAVRLGCPEEKPCGRNLTDSAATLSESQAQHTPTATAFGQWWDNRMSQLHWKKRGTIYISDVQAAFESAQKSNQALLEALEEIAEPIRFMQARAKDEGAQLDGRMAVELSEDHNFVKAIARAAIKHAKER
jgi:hypothetical protein